MTILKISGLRKTLGAEEILRGVELALDHGEKVGCVGRNGEGKTTLLRLIEGEETPDGGTIDLARGARVGYVVQRPLFAPGTTVRAHAEEGLAEARAVPRGGEAAGAATIAAWALVHGLSQLLIDRQIRPAMCGGLTRGALIDRVTSDFSRGLMLPKAGESR